MQMFAILEQACCQALNQQIITMKRRRRRGCSVHKPAKWHLPCSFCMTLAMSTGARLNSFGEAMSPRCSCLTRWVTDAEKQEILHSWPEWDIPSASPSLCLSLLISLQGQVQLDLRFHAGTSRFYCPIEARLPFTVCKRGGEFQIMLHMF